MRVHGVIRNATILKARIWFLIDTGWNQVGINEKRNQLLNEIITVRDYREMEREEEAERTRRNQRATEMDHTLLK